MKHAALACLVVPIALAWSANVHMSPAAEEQRPAGPWTRRTISDSPDQFRFAVVADRAGGHRPGVFADAIRKVNLLQPKFVLSVGDLIEGNTENADEIDRMWDEFDSIVGRLEAPFYYVPGNHGLTNDVMAKKWNERFGRSYYHFTYRNVLFLCLNTEEWQGEGISQEQADYFAEATAQHPQPRWTFVFMHKPMWFLDEDDPGWTQIEKMLQGRPYTVFAGHKHQYMKFKRFGQRYFILGTTGGASDLYGPALGLFDHVTWVTMTSGGPRIANLVLDGILDEDVRTEQSAKLVDGLFDATAIAPDSIFIQQPLFRETQAQIRLTNESDSPMTVKAAFEPHELLRPEPKQFNVIVPPRSGTPVDVELRVDKPIHVDGLSPLLMNWSVGYDRADHPPLEVEGTRRIAVDATFDCPRRTAPVVVDGRLNEWKELPLSCIRPAEIFFDAKNWEGPADGSFRFAAEYDVSYLYIAIEATDDRLVFEPHTGPWFQDGIEVRLDARAERPTNEGHGYHDAGKSLIVGLSPGDIAVDPLRPRQFIPPLDGGEAVCLKTKKGFTCEIAIPTEYLDRVQKQAWSTFRLNIAQDDYDGEVGDASNASQIWWRPDWRGSLNYGGSGTFRRH